MARVDLKGLFPVPLMRISGLFPEELISECVSTLEAATTRSNAKTPLLAHTEITDLTTPGPYQRLGDHVLPQVQRFGALLFGEQLDWSIKEIWANALETGGYQSVHAHSNSFVSGIVYLTHSHASARTVFHRSLGGRDFVFSNDNANARMDQYSGSKWVSPEVQPGDMVLYPSYLLHEVPVNEGPRRMTVAFNAIPDRLDSWGYTVRFSSSRSPS